MICQIVPEGNFIGCVAVVCCGCILNRSTSKVVPVGKEMTRVGICAFEASDVVEPVPC